MSVDHSIKEKAWEEVQKKAFTHWVNTLLEKRSMKIQHSLAEDFSDGITIINFVELLAGKKLEKKYNPNPKMRIGIIENTNLALQFLKENGVDPKFLTISAENFVDKKETLLLGFLWMLFRKFRIAKISGAEDKSEEEGLLMWVRKITEGYDGINIKTFKDSFNDAWAFMAMVDKYTEGKVGYKPNRGEKPTIETITHVFQLAEKNLGVPQLLDPKDLLNGTVDERSVVLYTSLFFHAFVTQEEKLKEKRAMESEFSSKKQKLSEEMELLLSQLEALKEDKRVLEKNIEDQKRLNQETKEKYEKKLHEKDDLLEKLQREKEDLENELNEWKKKYNALKERIEERSKLEKKSLETLRLSLVEHMNDMNKWKDYLEQDRDYDADTIQLRAENEIKARAIDDQLAYLADALDSENRKIQSLLKQKEAEEKSKKGK
eukprot:TRINITY_DN3938_c0_g2_i1.p1 TRINITY_DN3938_c0_g2~~TRINITY_DN3938_c0_g2_i1.p1  ORF type:complete len:432 (-),score=103.08 TRINITY_DN3938_c0_g2_i1:37-1332(-)